jgi:hypothetical protein
MAGVQVVVDGRPVVLDPTLAEVVRQLAAWGPALAPLDRWEARIDVAGRAVACKVWAPVRKPAGGRMREG